MKEALRAISVDLSQQLGSQLRAIYLYGSLVQDHHQADASDVNLLVIVSNDTDIHDLRAAFQPIWQEYGRLLRRAPLVARQQALQRHMTIHPNLAHHLARYGKLIKGKPNLVGSVPPLPVAEVFSHLADEAMELSAALAPDLLEPDVAQRYTNGLRSLARRLLQRHIEEEEPVVDLFAQIQDYLSRKIVELSTTQLLPPPPPSTTPLPGLQAVYKKELGRIVLVFSRLTARQIKEVDWRQVAEQLTEQCHGLHVTTAVQLRLITKLDRPLDIVFRRYELDWGKDALMNLRPASHYSLRHASRLPSNIQVDLLPNAYLTAEDEKIYDVIHDYQNRLLNIQLENEILHRLEFIDQFAPPEPLPGREAPAQKRIDAIFQHLGWWADYYFEAMQEYA